jgi:hypothetical protein
MGQLCRALAPTTKFDTHIHRLELGLLHRLHTFTLNCHRGKSHEETQNENKNTNHETKSCYLPER